MILTMDEEKVLDRIQHSFIICFKEDRTLSKLGIGEKNIYLDKHIYLKPVTEIIIAGEIQKFPLEQGTKEVHSFSLLPFKIVLDTLANAIIRDELNQGRMIKIWQQNELFAINVIIHIETAKTL